VVGWAWLFGPKPNIFLKPKDFANSVEFLNNSNSNQTHM
jgi:hypothetical protein